MAHCPSSDIMDQTQLNRQMPADNMVRTESSNIASPLLAKKNLPLSKDVKKNMAQLYQMRAPENEGLPTSPNIMHDIKK